MLKQLPISDLEKNHDEINQNEIKKQMMKSNVSFSMICAFVTKKEKERGKKLVTFHPEYKRLIRRKNVSLSNTVFVILRLNQNQTQNIPQKTNTFRNIKFKTRVKNETIIFKKFYFTAAVRCAFDEVHFLFDLSKF